MPIIDTQRRLSEIGRIRLGERQGNRPVKLDHFRLTSSVEGVLLKVAQLYGGTVTPWDNQFQITIEKDELPIVIPSYDGIFSEWYEQWSAGGVQKRCDSVTDEHRQCPCDCIPGQRDCKPISRLSVWLPEINSLGVWMLSSTGYNANAELGGSVRMVQDLERRLQRPIKTSLRLSQRKKVTGGKTFLFSVPVIEIREQAQAVLEAPAAPVVAVRAIEAAPVAIAEPPPDDNLVAPFDVDAELRKEGLDPDDLPPIPSITEPEPVDTSQDIIAENFRKSILIACREADIDTDERHEMITNVTEGRTNSIKQLREGELPLMWSRMQTTLMGKCTVLMNEIWSNPTTAYETLHKEFGLEDAVSTWQWKQWLQVFAFCKSKSEAK
jgi:hypothetical protein